ncbi:MULTISPECIES: methyl-accepting chemotaxis protein [Rhizobium/Agrobacterium group]|uniref:methyl-accepting chemotaxis protein n=1 Tax=Rhizobium/Agrobacterium group TaxID=227290 RepID=UPI0012E7EB7A|nr:MULTISPECIES: methyl-accepting chemotaxis protein [Rhizobium/Agrobacterium group]MVA52454.1 HAMP domain-containing protein [Agrobacterium vitis]NSZ51842.1 HAMP domain-containing protein [Agrobacterium vitis]NTA30601.1 HAMP domain-containing protein [Agrobacterium vitis]
MLFDRLLSRCKIQTKVLVFIVPFVLSISAVGLTGYYASRILQGQMEVTNSVVNTLSGFKNVYAAMTAFLQKTTDASKTALDQELNKQLTSLKTMRISLDGLGGAAQVDAAIAGTESIAGQVKRLWDLDHGAADLRAALEADTQQLSSQQSDLLTYSTHVREALAKDESQAKTMLRDSDRLTRGANLIADLVTDFNSATAPEAKMELVKTRMPELKKAVADIAAALPAEQAVLGTSLTDTVQLLSSQVEIGVTNDTTVGAAEQAINLMRPVSIRLQGASTLKSRQATAVFGTLDQPIAEATALLTATRQLVDISNGVELRSSRFMAAASADGLQKLQASLGTLKRRAAAMAKDPNVSADIKAKLSQIAPLTDAMADKATRLVAMDGQKTAAFLAAARDIDTIWSQLSDFAASQRQVADEQSASADTMSALALLAGVVIAIVAGIGLIATFKGPINQITAAMRRLASGDLQIEIAGGTRPDEIGDMARALGVFKDNAEAKIRAEAEGARVRAESEAERARNDAEKQQADQDVQFAVTELAAGLERLANGDVSATLDHPFAGRMEQLRSDFNRSLTRLKETIGLIQGNVTAIQGNVQQMAHSTDDLSRRTETQAASLEETAAAVNEVTSNVRQAADRAREVNDIVGETRGNAEKSAVVVGNAVSAMARIEDASKKIEQIISVIEEIAFQTNLLALNAGVEAARAGEAGKGFAVVAQEVRELAQRSGRAAKDIKALINTSTEEVNAGARLVQETGAALTVISQQIATISTHVEGIAAASRDQSAALGEVNSAVGQMDSLTQQNAAMVEETSAASRQLADEADQLVGLLQQFKLESGSQPGRWDRAA